MSLPTCTVNTNNIQNLPDSPTLSADELKQEFDKSEKDIKDYINDILLPAVEKLVKDEKANLETSINNKILADNKKKYHIGKIIMSTSNTNPNMYLGFGTWEFWGAGKVPVGVDTSDDDFSVVEKTGGEKLHKLTVEEMPRHHHSFQLYRFDGSTNDKAQSYDTRDFAGWTSTDDVGGDKEHNNLQPYITCYMWKRTA